MEIIEGLTSEQPDDNNDLLSITDGGILKIQHVAPSFTHLADAPWSSLRVFSKPLLTLSELECGNESPAPPPGFLVNVTFKYESYLVLSYLEASRLDQLHATLASSYILKPNKRFSKRTIFMTLFNEDCQHYTVVQISLRPQENTIESIVHYDTLAGNSLTLNISQLPCFYAVETLLKAFDIDAPQFMFTTSKLFAQGKNDPNSGLYAALTMYHIVSDTEPPVSENEINGTIAGLRLNLVSRSLRIRLSQDQNESDDKYVERELSSQVRSDEEEDEENSRRNKKMKLPSKKSNSVLKRHLRAIELLDGENDLKTIHENLMTTFQNTFTPSFLEDFSTLLNVYTTAKIVRSCFQHCSDPEFIPSMLEAIDEDLKENKLADRFNTLFSETVEETVSKFKDENSNFGPVPDYVPTIVNTIRTSSWPQEKIGAMKNLMDAISTKFPRFRHIVFEEIEKVKKISGEPLRHFSKTFDYNMLKKYKPDSKQIMTCSQVYDSFLDPLTNWQAYVNQHQKPASVFHYLTRAMKQKYDGTFSLTITFFFGQLTDGTMTDLNTYYLHTIKRRLNDHSELRLYEKMQKFLGQKGSNGPATSGSSQLVQNPSVAASYNPDFAAAPVPSFKKNVISKKRGRPLSQRFANLVSEIETPTTGNPQPGTTKAPGQSSANFTGQSAGTPVSNTAAAPQLYNSYRPIQPNSNARLKIVQASPGPVNPQLGTNLAHPPTSSSSTSSLFVSPTSGMSFDGYEVAIQTAQQALNFDSSSTTAHHPSRSDHHHPQQPFVEPSHANNAAVGSAEQEPEVNLHDLDLDLD